MKNIEQFFKDAQLIKDRYPVPHQRSALIPMLHLVQSYEGYVTPDGIRACAQALDISVSEVSAVATFYSQFKRHPNGEYTVGVCTNSLCAVMGGDELFDCLSQKLGIDHDQTTADGKITLERVECNAACDYAPVVMVNWEFFDNQTPESICEVVDDILAGKQIHPTRGPENVPTFKEVSRTLAGFEDGLANQGVSGGSATVLGKRIADENNWKMPEPVHTQQSEARQGEGK